MRPYPYDSLIVNGLPIHIDDLSAGKCLPADAFESALFSFVRQWLDGQETFVLRTSGSTGDPKEIEITREQMISSAFATQQVLGLKQGDSALVCLHPDYIAGKMMLVRCFVTGMRIFFLSPSANPLFHLGDQRIDLCALVPLQLHDVLQTPDSERLNQIRILLIGGGAIDEETIARLSDFTCKAFATYGMTETVSHIALRLLNTPDAKPYFTALPSVTLEVDPRGCLIINSPILTLPVITNDLVELVDKNKFVWIGRSDNVINSGGIKIIPERIEERITTMFRKASIANRFYVDSFPDSRLGDKVVLVVEGSVSADTIRSSLVPLKEVEPYAFPKLILFVPHFIQAANGKINRRATTNMAFRAAEPGSSSV
jgi:O-succinylbenzoic acid--CoA ligase